MDLEETARAQPQASTCEWRHQDDYTYTANGELETKTNRDTEEHWIYSYDVLGNLLSVGLPNGDLVEYLVDGAGRRVGKKTNGVLAKQWLYRDTLKPVAELDGNGALVSEFVYASKSYVPDYVRRGGATYRVISDHLGSPRYVVNVENASDVPFTATYSSFGVVAETDLGWMPFGFAGGMYDSDTGLVRFGDRDYDAFVGRWNSKDPILFEGNQANLFVYVDNDPVNFVDDDGTFADPAAELVGAAAWAGFTFGYYVLAPILVDAIFDAINESEREAFAEDIEAFNEEHADPCATRQPFEENKPNRKKQGRENLKKNRKNPNFQPRNPPREPPPHTPAKEHRKQR
jgi:RHS repeat-associated protein